MEKEIKTDKTLRTDMIKQQIIEGVRNGLCSIGLNHINEPLLRDDCIDIGKFAIDNGIQDVWLITNGTLLNRENIKEIIKSGITRLSISLDAATSQTYRMVRNGSPAAFQKLIKNIETVQSLRLRYESKLPLIRVSMVRCSLNENEVEYFKQHFRRIADFVSIQEFMSYTPELDKYLPTIRPENPHFVCQNPFQRLTIRGNGDVLPCCSVFGNRIVVGNVYKESIKDIWNNDKMNYIRAAHTNGGYSNIPACLECAKSSFLIRGE